MPVNQPFSFRSLPSGTRAIIVACAAAYLAQMFWGPWMAATLGLHARTLRRKLVSEGATYQAIVDEVRFRLAASYLTRTAMSHESISERLGFSDASSFRRAFKRWSQLSPNDFRVRQRGAD